MFENIFLFIEIFLFVFCLLYIIRISYDFIKIMNQKEGKLDMDTISLILFGSSLSYVITTLFVGF